MRDYSLTEMLIFFCVLFIVAAIFISSERARTALDRRQSMLSKLPLCSSVRHMADEKMEYFVLESGGAEGVLWLSIAYDFPRDFIESGLLEARGFVLQRENDGWETWVKPAKEAELIANEHPH